MRCPSCGYENLPGADACEQCETSLTQEDIPQARTDIERSLMEDPIAVLQPVDPLAIDDRRSLKFAINLMRERRIGCLLVTDDGGRLTGILTERDLLRKVAGQGLDLDKCPVRDFMSEAPESSKPQHPLACGLHRMIVSDIRYLPLVSTDGRPSGIVSARDIIAYMARHFQPEPQA